MDMNIPDEVFDTGSVEQRHKARCDRLFESAMESIQKVHDILDNIGTPSGEEIRQRGKTKTKT